MSIRINVAPTNPGQFFACCGLLELADRLWPERRGALRTGSFTSHAPEHSTSSLQFSSWTRQKS